MSQRKHLFKLKENVKNCHKGIYHPIIRQKNTILLCLLNSMYSFICGQPNTVPLPKQRTIKWLHEIQLSAMHFTELHVTQQQTTSHN